MTDQPSTQARCPTCGRPHPPSEYADAYINCTDPWHGSQDVEGEPLKESAEKGSHGAAQTSPSTTQEAEKALEVLQEAVERTMTHVGAKRHAEVLAALRSLRTQLEQDGHTMDALAEAASVAEAEVERLKDVAQGNWELAQREHDEAASARLQHTKDREEIERLQDGVEAATREIHKQGWQHTKAQERIEELEEQLTKKWWNKHEHELEDRIAELERVLANLGVQLTAGGSGDPAGGEVE